MQGMEDDGQTYLLPHPAVARVIYTIVGLFALVMPPCELLRGVWPLNFATPFIGFIMLGGMSVGAVFVYAGLAAPSAKLVFHEDYLEVHRKYLHTTRSSIIRAAGHDPIGSRPLGRQSAAEELGEVFRSKLGLKPPAP